MNKYRLLLLPFSFFYGLAIDLRNILFNLGVLKTTRFNIPIISVGNITVGGTGKTPHVEYLIELLGEGHTPAVLSRGYRRKTKGYLQATNKTTPADIGDEPFQIHSKHRNMLVAVCESRVEGVKQMLGNNVSPEVILLDDAFQHRYIALGLSILLIDYNRPVFDDFLLPAGNLRERMNSIYRADIIIVSKTPEKAGKEDLDTWRKKIVLKPYQKLYFSGFEYGNLLPVFTAGIDIPGIDKLNELKTKVLVVTGIASPVSLFKYLDENGIDFETIQFPDHHNFSHTDIRQITARFEDINSANKILLTTEKDTVRLRQLSNIPESLAAIMYYLPVKVKILDNKAEEFNRMIIDYVKTGLTGRL